MKENYNRIVRYAGETGIVITSWEVQQFLKYICIVVKECGVCAAFCK